MSTRPRTSVLTTTEARSALPSITQRFHEEGVLSEVVFFGPHRRPEAVLMPAELFEAFEALFEDLVIATQIRARLAEDDGTRVTLEELDRKHSWSEAEISAEAESLAREFGLD